MRSVQKFYRWFASGPYAAVLGLTLVYLLYNAAVRLGLALYNGDASVFWSGRIVGAMLIGAVFDLGVAALMLLPLMLLLLMLRHTPGPRDGGFGRRFIRLSLLPFAGLLVFVAAAEFVFWNEFASRFNFIAVDYLVYTNEVIGNIRESYPMPLLLSAVAITTLLFWRLILRVVSGQLREAAPRIGGRLARTLVWMLLPVAAYALLDASYKEYSNDAQANELAGNGVFDFFHAYESNSIDYERFYRTLPQAQALSGVREALNIEGPPLMPFDLRREVQPEGAQQDWNVVLVSMESLSASYLAHFGNREGLTPNLDRMADEGLLFKQLYATGTRTVRGLEALTLSVPPTPGHSIVKRPNNDNLYSLGSIFAGRGYTPMYIYGGYSYFDNMQAFFSGNGYQVHDRTELAPEDIHFQNIWGVCDEDLFTLALREIDQQADAGKHFFAHIMTVSNHRPYTYPEGRIDIPSKSGREGGVKYTDWAIGDFIERARSKPWFDHTLFIFVADHTHRGRGKMDLPPRNYLIPMVVWAPGKIAAGTVEHIASQIDVAPTILGLMNVPYESRFFGSDMLSPDAPQRALLANYQTVGWYEHGRVIELKPNARSRVVDARTGIEQSTDAEAERMTTEAISYYQVASEAFGSGAMRLDAPTPTAHLAGAADAH